MLVSVHASYSKYMVTYKNCDTIFFIKNNLQYQ